MNTSPSGASDTRPMVRFTLLIASTLTVMSGAIITASLPVMEQQFGAVPYAEYLVRLVLTLPALFIVLGAPLAGLIVDRYGRKPLLLLGLLLYAFAGSSGYFLQSLPAILVSRAALGLSVAAIMTSVTTLIADYFSGPERARVLGQQAAFMGLGGTIYTTLGGFLSDLHWRNPFLIYLASLLILPFAILWVRETVFKAPPRPASADLAPPQRETLPLGPIAMIYAIVSLLQVIFYLIPVQMPFYLKGEFAASGKLVGLAIGLGTLSYALGSLLSPRIAPGLSRPARVALSFALVAAGYAVVALAPSYPLVILGLVVAGQGFGYLIPQLAVWLTTVAPPALRGRVLGGQTTAVFLGQFLSPILAQPIIQWLGYRAGYLSATLLLGTLAIVALLIARLRSRRAG